MFLDDEFCRQKNRTSYRTWPITSCSFTLQGQTAENEIVPHSYGNKSMRFSFWKEDAVFTVTYRGFCVSRFTSWSCTGGGVRIMTLMAYLSSQPAVKVSLLQLLKTRLVINVKSLLKISVESHLCKRIKKLTDFVYFLFTVGMLRTMTCCFPVSCRPCCHVWRAPQKISWCPDLSTVLWYGTLFPVISRSILKILISSSVWK